MDDVSWTTRGVKPKASQNSIAPRFWGEDLERDPGDPAFPGEPRGLLHQGAAHALAPVAGVDHDPRDLEGALVGEPGGYVDLAVGHPHHLPVGLGHQHHGVLPTHGRLVLRRDLVVEARARREHPPVPLHPIELLEQRDQGRYVLPRRLPDLHTRHLPSNLGSRFSRNARIPSAASIVANSPQNTSRSNRSPSSGSPRSEARRAALAAASARVGPEA